MWQYALLLLRRSSGRSALAGSGFLLAACALVLLSATALTTVVQARQIISRNWRSSYDLIVLPPSKHVSPSQSIPMNQFEGYDGGISTQQYEQIKTLPGVAVAAPLAFVGYVQYPYTAIQVGPTKLSPGFYQLEWTQTAFDGRHHVLLNHQAYTFYEFPNSEQCTNANPCYEDSKVAAALTKLGVEGDWSLGLGEYRDILPDVGTFLLAAIDPEQENHLFHLDQSIVQGRMLTSQDVLRQDKIVPSVSLEQEQGANYDLPLLFNTQSVEQVHLSASLVHLETDTLDPQRLLARSGNTALNALPRQTLFAGDLPLARYNPQLSSSGSKVYWNGHTWQVQQDHPGSDDYPLHLLNLTFAPTGVNYHAFRGPAGTTTSAYTLVPNEGQIADRSNQTEISFRDLNPLPSGVSTINTQNDEPASLHHTLFHIYNGAVYTPHIIGQFEGGQIASEFTHALSWLPEAAYASSSSVLRYDAQGKPVPSQTLLPTANPGSFLQQPPRVLTTLAAAQRIRGDHCISVIRIRLAGDITADEAGLQHIAQVAQAIQQRTGLRVLVTLGSSPVPRLVYVPGLKQGQLGVAQTIDPIGWVEQRWIVIGIGLVYLNQLGQTQRLLLGAVLLVCLGYLAVTLSSLVAAQRRELAVLSALGWEPWQPAGLFLIQAFVLALGGGIAGIGLALLIVALIGASPPWDVVSWALPSVLGLALLSALYPLWQLWHIQPAEVLRAGMFVSSRRAPRLGIWFESYLSAVGGMALRNLTRSRMRALIALGSLFLSAILLTMMVDGILAFRQTLQGTLLGEYVLLQTAVPQIAGAVFAVLLTFLSVADLLLLQVRERRREIGLLQAVGWRPRIVQGLFVKEGLTLALLGAAPGVVVALGVLAAEHQVQGAVPVPIVALGSVLLLLLVAALATIPAVRAANRTQLIEILRAE